MATRQTLSDSQEGFGGGFSTAAGREIVPTDCFASMENMRVVQNGEVAKRPGLRLLSNDPLFLDLHSMNGILIGTTPYLIFEANGKFGYATFNEATGALAITYTGLTSFAPDIDVPNAPFRDGTGNVVYMPGGGGGQMYKIDTIPSPSVVSISFSPVQLWVYNQRLFGVAGNNQTLVWSGLNNGDTLGDTANGGGSAAIRTFRSGYLLGGFALGGINYLVHNYGLSFFQGRTFDDIQIQAGTQGVSPDIRPIAGTSWKVVDLTGYIVTKAGLYLIDVNGSITSYQDLEQVPLSDPIVELLGQNYSVTTQSIAENVRANEIWFTFSVLATQGGQATSRTLIYNKRLRRFTGTRTGNLSAGWFFSIGEQLFNISRGALGGSVSACDFRKASLNVFQDNGSNYTSSVTCRRMFTEAPRNTKAFRWVSVRMGSGTDGTQTPGTATGATVSYSTPFGGTVADTTSLAALRSNEIQASGQGQYIDVTVTDAGAVSTDWSVQAVVVDAFDYGRRGA